MLHNALVLTSCISTVHSSVAVTRCGLSVTDLSLASLEHACRFDVALILYERSSSHVKIGAEKQAKCQDCCCCTAAAYFSSCAALCRKCCLSYNLASEVQELFATKIMHAQHQTEWQMLLYAVCMLMYLLTYTTESVLIAIVFAVQMGVVGPLCPCCAAPHQHIYTAVRSTAPMLFISALATKQAVHNTFSWAT